MRDSDLRDDDVRLADRHKVRGSWVAPLVVLALVIGVGWWVLDRASDDGDLIGGGPNAVVVPDQPGMAPPATPAPNGGLAAGGGAATATATGTIDQFDPQRRTMTLDNGDTFVLANNVTNIDALSPGQRVTVTYRMDNDQKIVQSVIPAPGSITPGAAPNPVNPVNPDFQQAPGMAPNIPPRANP